MKIIRIKKVDNDLIKKINQLFDDKEWDLNEGNKFLSNNDNAFFLAFEENQPVGFLSAHRLQRFDNRKAEVLLYEIGVHQDFRKMGIGKALVDECKKWAKKIDASEVWVLTEKDNPAAMALYSSSGGEEESPGTLMYVFKL